MRRRQRYNIRYSTGIMEDDVRDLVVISRVLNFIFSSENERSIGDTMTLEVAREDEGEE